MRVTQKGFRTKQLMVVTTLLDAEEYSGRRDRRALPSQMAGGAQSPKPQNGFADGSPALQDATPGAQRVLHAPRGLQPDPADDGAGRARVGDVSVAGEFQRGVANARTPSCPRSAQARRWTPGATRWWPRSPRTPSATVPTATNPDCLKRRRNKYKYLRATASQLQKTSRMNQLRKFKSGITPVDRNQRSQEENEVNPESAHLALSY